MWWEEFGRSGVLTVRSCRCVSQNRRDGRPDGGWLLQLRLLRLCRRPISSSWAAVLQALLRAFRRHAAEG